MHLSSGCFDHSISRSLRKKGFGRDHFDNGPQEALRCLFSYVQHSLHQREDFSGSCLYAQDQAYTKKSANRMG